MGTPRAEVYIYERNTGTDDVALTRSFEIFGVCLAFAQPPRSSPEPLHPPHPPAFA